jgi:hypothetical protein
MLTVIVLEALKADILEVASSITAIVMSNSDSRTSEVNMSS